MSQPTLLVSTKVVAQVNVVTVVSGSPVFTGPFNLQAGSMLEVFQQDIVGASPNELLEPNSWALCVQGAVPVPDGACIYTLQPIPVSLIPPILVPPSGSVAGGGLHGVPPASGA